MSGLLDRMVNEHRKAAERFPVSCFEKFQAFAPIIHEQPALSLIERIAPEAAQTPPRDAVEPRIEHRSHSVEPHLQARPEHDVPKKVSESVVTQKPRRAWFEDAADLAHHLGFVRVG